jgi:Predicted Zn-dependent proteases and their inactivated homologs
MPFLDDLADALIAAAGKAGADAADAIALRSEDVGVAVREGALEEAERAESTDFGLRVFVGRRQACVSASDPRPEVVAALAERAVAMAREAPEDPWCGLPEPGQLGGGQADAAPLALDDPGGAPSPDALEAQARALEGGARAVPGVAQVESASAAWRRSEVALAATNGFRGGYARASASLSVSAIAGAGLGMETDYDYAVRRRAADLPAPEAIGRSAAERAVARLDPKSRPQAPPP